MLRAAPLALALTLGACVSATPAPDRQAAFERASDAAFRTSPRPDPIPLPSLTPPTRLQSELGRMAARELASWILPPDEAGAVVASDILTGHMPRATAIVLYRAPAAAETIIFVRTETPLRKRNHALIRSEVSAVAAMTDGHL